MADRLVLDPPDVQGEVPVRSEEGTRGGGLVPGPGAADGHDLAPRRGGPLAVRVRPCLPEPDGPADSLGPHVQVEIPHPGAERCARVDGAQIHLDEEAGCLVRVLDRLVRGSADGHRHADVRVREATRAQDQPGGGLEGAEGLDTGVAGEPEHTAVARPCRFGQFMTDRDPVRGVEAGVRDRLHRVPEEGVAPVDAALVDDVAAGRVLLGVPGHGDEVLVPVSAQKVDDEPVRRGELLEDTFGHIAQCPLPELRIEALPCLLFALLGQQGAQGPAQLPLHMAAHDLVPARSGFQVAGDRLEAQPGAVHAVDEVGGGEGEIVAVLAVA